MAQRLALSQQLGLNVHGTNSVATLDDRGHCGTRPVSYPGLSVQVTAGPPSSVRAWCGGFPGILSVFIEGKGEFKKGVIRLLIDLTHRDLPITPSAGIVPSS